MNGRTCQLCGKALSRFSVGSGGDFCSREHRNQFRLRSGMDRLMEANKVASLMRRRENAKAIPSAQLARDSKVLPRMAPLLRMPMRLPDVATLRPLAASLGTPQILAKSRNLSCSNRPTAPMLATARTIEPEPFRVRRLRRFMPARNDHFPVQIAQAGAVIPRLNSARLADLRRQVVEMRINLCRTNIGGNGIQVRPLNASPQKCQEPQKARRLNNFANGGRELRVSGGIGFRLTKPRLRSVDLDLPGTMLPSRSTTARTLGVVARPHKSDTSTAGALRFTVRIPSVPSSPRQIEGAEMQWPELPVDGSPRPRQSAAQEAKTTGVKWTAPAAIPPQFRHHNGLVHFRIETSNTPSFQVPNPRHIHSTRRLTLVPFQPQEVAFEWSPSALHGTLASNTAFGSKPVRKIEAPPATLEEHFDAGLQNWQGGTGDWKVDVAGVRAGSLALYYPSLEIRNYLLEFLTRIESKSITWVFRASSLTDYYQATLTVMPGGGYEFQRSAVIAGQAEGSIVRVVPPATPAPTGKTAVTIRTRVTGNEFAVSLDGQTIETWSDKRLIEGGIGFAGAPEERTRLYWVKVTPIGPHSKEYSKR